MGKNELLVVSSQKRVHCGMSVVVLRKYIKIPLMTLLVLVKFWVGLESLVVVDCMEMEMETGEGYR